MRVVIHHTKFYDWDPVPKGVVVTEADIAAGKVMPDRNGGYRMKVVKTSPAGAGFRICHISEGTLIEKIIEEKSDIRKAGRTLTRHQAAAHLIMDHILPNNLEAAWITKFEVEDDGPSEELMRAKLEPHTKAEHARRPGRANVPAEHVDDHVKQYLGQWQKLPDPTDATHMAAKAANHQSLATFLHQHFGVK